jgi:hypothetical protein
MAERITHSLFGEFHLNCFECTKEEALFGGEKKCPIVTHAFVEGTMPDQWSIKDRKPTCSEFERRAE